MTTKLDALLYYTKQDWKIFPVHYMVDGGCSCKKPNCTSPGKHPLTSDGFKSATSNREQVETWHRQFPDANWGLRTGDRATGGSGLLIIDVDGKTGGFVGWEELEEDPAYRFETVESVTGSGDGLHYWLEYPEGYDIRNSAGKLATGVDIRANGGYIVIPPSKTKQMYTFRIKPGDVPLAPTPPELIKAVNGKKRTVPSDSTESEVKPTIEKTSDVIPAGQRHQALISMVGKLRNAGLDEAAIRGALYAYRDSQFATGDHPVPDSEIEACIKWGVEQHKNYVLSDIGNGLRFADQHRGKVLWCQSWEKWLLWDRRRWVLNDMSALRRLAHITADEILREARRELDEDKKKKLIKHAFQMQNSTRLNAMLNEASPYMSVDHKIFDQKDRLLNVANGTVDLTNGNLKPFNQKDFFTKIIDVPFVPDAECPRWEEFIDLVTGGNKEMALYIQKAVGYSLTGLTNEQCLFFLFGSGINGKTVFTEVLRKLFGEYSVRIKIDALLGWQPGGAADPFIAIMNGSRLVIGSEIPEGRKWNEPLIKDLTGSDTMVARFLYGNPFEFEPKHTLWVFGNSKPAVVGTDAGIKRRVKLIPFEVRIPDEIRLPFDKVMRMFTQEITGILTWAILGSVLYFSEGLETPDTVRDATKDYYDEFDLIAQFLDEKCEAHPDYQYLKADVYKAWREWVEENGEKDALRRSSKWFTYRMKDHGHELGGKGNRDYMGIRLK